jgi:hypothetical protein
MRIPISSYIRRLAALIETDETPTEDEIKKKRLCEEECATATKAPNRRKGPKVKEEKIFPTERPHIKPPRRKLETRKKWNNDTKTDNMREYMQDYRQTGKVNETNSPKNKYTKKPKV